MANNIIELPNNVQKAIRSGIGFGKISECMMELIYNSIDAGSTCIAIRFDLNKFYLQILDNGEGISKDGLKMVGKRYTTSKLKSVRCLEQVPKFCGYKGEALCTIIDLSKTCIITSKQEHAKTYQKIFYQGAHHDVLKIKVGRPSKGTSVVIGGLFYNKPVRQKNFNLFIEVQNMTTSIKNLALIFPKISFSLYDRSKNEYLLRLASCKTIPDRYNQIYNHNVSKEFTTMRFRHLRDINVSAFFGKFYSNLKNQQLIFINGRQVECKKMQKVLNSHVNDIINDGSLNDSFSLDEKLKECNFVNFTPDDVLYPVYIINMVCPIYKFIAFVNVSNSIFKIEYNEVFVDIVQNIVAKLKTNKSVLNSSSSKEDIKLKIDKLDILELFHFEEKAHQEKYSKSDEEQFLENILCQMI
ncbi:DNA mismatch repair protein Mlh3-like [Ctenocephalides felis]|uniref:DNA mismatch repair protein Mlh3-like n=1 Tax=Ctenocephalides felis TaxID=7515 RepID=UPI000E6E17B5|nr:DNA mismatch repair protein Mlh3-like [Ctenocephalides felis]